MTVYVLDSRFFNEERIEKYAGYLPKERQIKIEKSVSMEQKCVQAAAGVLIGYALWQYTENAGSDKQEICMLAAEDMRGFLEKHAEVLTYSLEYGEQGKPNVLGRDDFHFNLSHSGSYVVCVTDSCSIGVDIQKVDAKKGRRIADRFFAKTEQESLQQIPEAEFERLFCRIWAAKESYLKFLGTGLQGGLSSHAVDLEKSVVLDENGTQKAVLREFDCLDGYALFVCEPKKVEK